MLIYQFIFLLCFCLNGNILCLNEDPDENRNTSELIRSNGYICDDHKVLTDDGYYLGMQRISKNETSNEQRPVVFLLHGLLDSSSTWVVNMVNQSLGFILCDLGYDVWLGNTRGNKYSREHKTLNINQTEFWNFGLDEMAKYDLPAMIDYVLEQTNQSQLSYIGHSQGNTVGFATFSFNQELAAKIKVFMAMGPVANVGNMLSPFRYLSGPPAFLNPLWKSLFGEREFLPDHALIQKLGDFMCEKGPLTKLCDNIIFLLVGPTTDVNQTRVPIYLSHYPSGASTKNVLHFSQMIYSKNFQMFDYASAENNKKHYNQTTPPLYNLKNVRVPTALFSSGNDWLGSPKDVQILRDNLPNIVYDQFIPTMDHLDFIWGLNATSVIYPNVFKLLKEFS